MHQAWRAVQLDWARSRDIAQAHHMVEGLSGQLANGLRSQIARANAALAKDFVNLRVHTHGPRSCAAHE